jgi:hypothetical protein
LLSNSDNKKVKKIFKLKIEIFLQIINIQWNSKRVNPKKHA